MKRFLIIILTTFTINNCLAQSPKLIEFGWDYPDVSELHTNLSAMQHTPFNGICFSFQRSIMEAFDTVVQKDSYFEYEKLRSLQWGKYTDNYIILRGYGPSGPHWFNDKSWKKFLENARSVSKAMTVGNITGILFDPEYYNEDPLYNPWIYNKKIYPAQSFSSVRSKVKQRGREFIQALQSSKKKFTLLSIWLTSLIAEDLKILPLQDTRHVLLIPFFEGILEAKLDKITITDGNEIAYWYTQPSEFLGSRERLQTKLRSLVETKHAKSRASKISIAQPIYYDGLLAKLPIFERGLQNSEKWNWLNENLRYALASTDEIVWFYSESINWWKKPVNDTLVEVLKNNLEYFAPNKMNAGKNRLNSDALRYTGSLKAPMKKAGKAFTHTWDKSSKKLKLDFIGKIPQTLQLYLNNCPPMIFHPDKFTFETEIKNFNGGKLAVVALFPDGSEAVTNDYIH